MSHGEVGSSSVRAVLKFGAALVLVSVVYFAVMYTMSRPRLDSVTTLEPLVAEYTTDTLSLDPAADHWRAIEPVSIRLLPQAARAPFGTEEREILLRAVYNDREIAFLIEYADDTEDRSGSLRPDACAVMLTPEPGPATAQMMGHGGTANIWHWVADTGVGDSASVASGTSTGQIVRDLLATGPGTQAELGLRTVEARGTYAQGRWSVVFKRLRASSQTDELEVTPTGPMSVSFAVWDGSRGESLSAKSISVLRPLHLGRR